MQVKTKMKLVVSFAIVIFALCQTGHSLQMVLPPTTPLCLYVTPKRVGITLDINYSISGVDEEKVQFIVSCRHQSSLSVFLLK